MSDNQQHTADLPLLRDILRLLAVRTRTFYGRETASQGDIETLLKAAIERLQSERAMASELYPEYANSADDFYEHFTPRKEPNMSDKKELVLNKPCETVDGVPVHLACGCSTKGTCCWHAKTTKDSTHLNTLWTDNFGNPEIPGFPAVVNAPDPEPPRTFDLAKALRMTLGVMSGQLPADTVVAENPRGTKYYAVLRYGDRVFAVPNSGVCHNFPLSGSWEKETWLFNSHIPEPEFVERWVLLTANESPIMHYVEQDAKNRQDELHSNFYGSAKVTIYKGATI